LPTESDAIFVCDDVSCGIPRQPDASAFYLHCTGGFRAVKVEEDKWVIEPILHQKVPCQKGFFTKKQLRHFIRSCELEPVALQHLFWIDGDYLSSWKAIDPGVNNHFRGPADLWSSITHNLSTERSAQLSQSDLKLTHKKIAEILDSRLFNENVSKSISLSLRNIDISIEEITSHYNQQLVSLLAAGVIDERRVSTTQDHTLFAHVHSFFVHLAAARDYLATLIALKIGMDPNKIDCMARLLKDVRTSHFEGEPLLKLLQSKGLLQPAPGKLNKWEASGWLKAVTEVRNELTHRRPYGSKYVEGAGYVVEVSKKAGIFRYFRPMLEENGSEKDILDLIVANYKNATSFFRECAKASGMDSAMLTLTDKDIRSFDLKYI
jgi:hypothetical protein